MDAQTRVEHTLGLAALIQAMVSELAEHYEAGGELLATTRTRCSTRTAGWRRATGSRASSSTCRARDRSRRGARAARSWSGCEPHAQELGSAAELEGVRRPDRARNGGATASRSSTRRTTTSPSRARDRGGHGRSLTLAVRARPRTRRIGSSMASGPDLFVVCKSCGSEVSPYITECPYCGTRLRKRAPKLERGGTPKAPRRARARGSRRCARRDPGHPARPAPVRDDRAGRRLGRRHAAAARAGVGPRRRPGRSLGPLDGDWWRLVTTQFVYGNTGYEVAALAAIAIFGVAARAPPRLVGAARRVPRRRRGSGWRCVAAVDSSRRDGRQRRGARAARRVGDARRARPPARARGRRRPARRARDRRAAGAAADRDATRRTRSPGLGGGVAGIVIGLGLARLRRAMVGRAPRLLTRRGRGGDPGARRPRAAGGGAAGRRARNAPGHPADPQRGARRPADWFGSAHSAARARGGRQAGRRRAGDGGPYADRRGDGRRRC